jgi:hypothetical protein
MSPQQGRCIAAVTDVRGTRQCAFRALSSKGLCGIHTNQDVDSGTVVPFAEAMAESIPGPAQGEVAVSRPGLCKCGKPVEIVTNGVAKCWDCYAPSSGNVNWRDMIWTEPPGKVFHERDLLKNELAELRSYRDRTEAALAEFSSTHRVYLRDIAQQLRDLGLWRDPQEPRP